MLYSQKGEIGNVKFKFEGYPFELPKDHKEVVQVYGILITEDKRICIVEHKMGFKILPGGKTIDKEGLTFEEVLIEEAWEEADVKINNKRPFFMQKEWKLKDDEYKYRGIALRYIADIAEIHDSTPDPDGDIIGREFVTVDEFSKKIGWGVGSDWIAENLEKFSNQL